ncbi:De-etiolated protein 1 Det1-domain-containing protein [Gorgonomyces haynaldii]|nr:De-etiolated protein 1 Det1-domain-containing protein [Gorgonomyces haynaldii]
MLLKRILDRENGHQNDFKNIYLNIFPNQTLYSIDNGDLVVKKFSPDGQFLVCFSQYQHALKVFRFRYSSKQDKTGFDDFFQLHFEIVLTRASEILSREFCLFWESSVIVVSTVPSFTPPLPMPGSLDSIAQLDDMTFWIIDLQKGTVTDSKKYIADYVYLSQHCGVHLYKDHLAITSLQYQRIYLLLLKNGKFCSITDFGYSVHSDDALYLSKTEPQTQAYLPEHTSEQFSGLQQRILSFLYRNAQQNNRLHHFYVTFSFFESLVICRAQFINTGHLLIKITLREAIVGKFAEYAGTFTAFFVVFRLEDCQVLQIYENASQELYDLFEQSHELRQSGITSSEYESLPTNSKYAREKMQKQTAQAYRRILAALPWNAQSFTFSPYFDQDLFSYDEKLINASDRPRQSAELPCKFYCRKTGVLKFKLDPTVPTPLTRTHKYYFLC